MFWGDFCEEKCAQEEANGCADLARMRIEISGRASRVVQQARDIEVELKQYAKLWQADKAVALAQFLL